MHRCFPCPSGTFSSVLLNLLWSFCRAVARCNRAVSALTELEKQMKIENLFVTWQQRSAQSNMPISVSTITDYSSNTAGFETMVTANLPSRVLPPLSSRV